MKNDVEYLTWSAERLFEMVRDEEARRAVLGKKATLWLSGLLAVMGAVATTSPAGIDLTSVSGVLYLTGFLATVASAILATGVIGADSSMGISPNQLADPLVLEEHLEKRLRDLCAHLLSVMEITTTLINSKGKRLESLQFTALGGALCFLVGRFLDSVTIPS